MVTKIFYVFSIMLVMLSVNNLLFEEQSYVVISNDKKIEIIITSEVGIKKLDTDYLFRAGQTACIGAQTYQVFNDCNTPAAVEGEVFIVTCRNVGIQDLSTIKKMSHFVLACKISSKRRYEIKEWCTSKDVYFHDLSNGYLKLKL